MAESVPDPRFRGFICLTAHPQGCASNVGVQVAAARSALPGKGIGNALVIGSSAGFGLSSLITLLFGYGARCLGVCLERPAKGDKFASAGYYNVAATHAQARQVQRQLVSINGDAYAPAVKDEVIATLKQRFGPVDHVVYSLASPRRTDPVTGVTYASALKPTLSPFTGKSINLDTGEVTSATIPPATPEEVEATRKVMGGEDWKLWIDALGSAGLLAKGCRTVAYSYIGPQVTFPIYRTGSIGKAKEHLEATAHALDQQMQASCRGHAWVSINKALVTQAASAIPMVPLYTSLLYKVMKEAGTHEGTIEQMIRLWGTHLGPDRTPHLDGERRIRMDDREMAPAIQEEVGKRWARVDTANLNDLGDWTGYRTAFHQLFGFDVPGLDYDRPVESEVPWD